MTLQVRVTSGGSPVSGASVYFITMDGGTNRIGPYSTDSNGYASYQITQLAPGSSLTWYATASKSGYTDAQSSTWSFIYSPPAQISASIITFYPASGTYSPGTAATSSLTFKNTCTVSWTFYVSYSVIDANGNAYDVTPTAITLDVGQTSGPVSRTWTVPTNAVTGWYRVVMAVWKNDPSMDKSQTALDQRELPNSFQVQISTPALTVTVVSPPSPSNGGTVTSLPMTLQVRVTSGGSPVSGASVKFYLDGNPLPGSPFSSDQDGYASLTFASGSLTSGTTIRWYATVQKSGYADGQSPTWSFTYSVARGSSAISAKVSTSTIIIGRRVTVSGFIDPPHSAIVTLRFTKPDHASIERTSTSSASGYYSYAFAVDSAGIWSVETSWLGDDDHVGSESLAQSFEVVSETRLIVTVVDAETNEELAGVEVTLDPSGEVRRTDENQPAVFLVQLGRSYTIHAEMEGYESNEIEVDVPASVEYDVQVKLTPVREFSGTGKIVSCTSEEIYGGYPFSIHVSVLGSVSEKTKGVLEASIEGFSIATSKKFDVSGSFYEDGIELYFKTSPTEGTVRFHVTLTLVNPSTGELVQEDSTTFEEQIAGVQWDKAKVKLRIQCTGDTPWFSNIEAGAARIELWSSSGQREDVTDRFKDAWWKNWCMPTIDGEFELDPGFSYAFYVRFDTGNWVGARICYRFDVEIQDMITLAARETQITVTLHYSKEGGEYSVWGDVKVSPDIAGVRYVEEGYSHD
jgi:hypothetical protein